MYSKSSYPLKNPMLNFEIDYNRPDPITGEGVADNICIPILHKEFILEIIKNCKNLTHIHLPIINITTVGVVYIRNLFNGGFTMLEYLKLGIFYKSHDEDFMFNMPTLSSSFPLLQTFIIYLSKFQYIKTKHINLSALFVNSHPTLTNLQIKNKEFYCRVFDIHHIFPKLIHITIPATLFCNVSWFGHFDDDHLPYPMQPLIAFPDSHGPKNIALQQQCMIKLSECIHLLHIDIHNITDKMLILFISASLHIRGYTCTYLNHETLIQQIEHLPMSGSLPWLSLKIKRALQHIDMPGVHYSANGNQFNSDGCCVNRTKYRIFSHIYNPIFKYLPDLQNLYIGASDIHLTRTAFIEWIEILNTQINQTLTKLIELTFCKYPITQMNWFRISRHKTNENISISIEQLKQFENQQMAFAFPNLKYFITRDKFYRFIQNTYNQIVID
jgi:hypothetical protein